jgi:excisionase family DNA binding protein
MVDQPPTQLPELFTEKEISEYLGCVKATLARKRRAGEISFTRVGGNVRYTEAQILQYLEDQTCPATNPGPIKSATTGSPDVRTGPSGTGHGAARPDGYDAAASLLRSLEKPRPMTPPTPANGLDGLDEQESLRRLLEKDRGKRRNRLPPPGR